MAVLKKYCASTLKWYFYEEYYLVGKTIRTDIYKVSVFWNQRLFEMLWKNSKMLLESKIIPE